MPLRITGFSRPFPLNEEMFDFARRCAMDDKRVTFFYVGIPTMELPDDCEIYVLRPPLSQSLVDTDGEEAAR